MKDIKILIKTITLLNFCYLTQCFNLEIIEPDVLEPMVFVDSKLTDYYNASVYEQNFVCTNGELQIIEFQQSSGQQVIRFRYSGAELIRQDIEISVQPNVAPKPKIRDFNRVYKNFTLDAGCPAVITKNNYYNRVKIKLKIHEQQPKRKTASRTNRKTEQRVYQFSFLLNCDLWDVHKNFEYGYIFISIICITIVVFVSLHPRICSIVINKQHMNFQIKWQWFLLLITTILGILGFIYEKKGLLHKKDLKNYFINRNQNDEHFQIVNQFLKNLGLLASLFYVFVCFSELFFQYSSLLSFFPFKNMKIGNTIIKKRYLVSALISLSCYISGLYYENWVFYNFLSFFIAIGSIKMFRFRSLRNGVYTMFIVLIAVAIFTVWSFYKLPRSVNDYASQLSSPLFVQVPDLVNNLYKKCSWISICDMILPGAILAYLRDYDENYHTGWQGVYTLTSILSFSFSCLGWILIEALIEYNIPFCIVIYPPFLMSIILLAVYRNEFETLWNGYFHFTHDQSIMQLIQDYDPNQNTDGKKNHKFPQQILQDIQFQQSRWSEGEQKISTNRKAIDESEVQVWSATLQLRKSQDQSNANQQKKDQRRPNNRGSIKNRDSKKFN